MSNIEPHALGAEAFFDEVQSFEFWFGAVEGYLTDRPFGHSSDTVDVALDDVRRDRLITTLCNYCVGETAALEGSSGLVRLAPNRNAKIFMATQVVDEARHLEVFLARLKDLGVDDAEAEIQRRANPLLLDFKDSLLELVDAGEWSSAVFAQNVILETMEFTVFRAHERTADPITAEVLRGVISDERRHFGFGENDIGRRVAQDPDLRSRLKDLRTRFDAMVVGVFDDAVGELALTGEGAPDLSRDYMDAVSRLGLGQ
ncbi:MAG: ferritin-like domain-containing protein [Actinomycetia bacterium]|nr:ferritin-like domain-containing protein [Actinomycetes bacterium]MCP4961803.1 ferritin-like domain-containing protein [Actinomycetes bacterium]